MTLKFSFMKQNKALVILLLIASFHSAGQNLNTTRAWSPQRPMQIEADVINSSRTTQEVLQQTQYIDGFGRTVQSVSKQTTPLQMDLVNFHKYDALGRESQQFLPFVSGNDGNYKTNAEGIQLVYNQALYPGETHFYGQLDIENSPSNRTLKAYAPGSSWVGSGRGTTLQQLVNTDVDNVRIWNIDPAVRSIPTSPGYYTAGLLTKTITTDEKNLQVIEYKDKNGKSILKKSQLSAAADNGSGSVHSGWLCTYYVYDDYGNMRFMITPKAVSLIDGSWSISQLIADELCYRYEFDQFDRTIIKKNPGTTSGIAGEVWTVYDKRGRTVMVQDGNMRAQQKWQYFQYDNEDRPIATGLMTDPGHYQDLDYHRTLAEAASVNPSYPNLGSYATELLTQTFYDNYNWTGGTGLGGTMDATNINNSSYFYTASNTSFPYPQQIIQTSNTRGKVTGSKTQVMGSGGTQFLYTVNFYDDYDRVIQTQGTNITGGIDKVTTQYSWSGLVLRILEEQTKATGTTQTHRVLTKMNYGAVGRLSSITKTISTTINTTPGATVINTPEKTIATYAYTELGVLKTKTVGTNASSAPIETLSFDYNVRGWPTGINKNFTQTGNNSNYFGEELGYDKTTTTNGTTSFAAPAYDGSITGLIWKAKGDGVPRKYDYTYDNTSQLTAANYLQNTGGSAWDKSYIDYSVNSISYDLNGNIKTLNQNGFILGGGSAVDNLAYNYMNNEVSNKLQNVIDNANNAQSKLGDFHYAGSKTISSVDYAYDAMGSKISDANKTISSITYNPLNLPLQVTVTGKGTITYTYDAAGNKLKKVAQENGVTVFHAGANHVTNITTTTTYIGGAVYQSKSYSNGALSSLNVPEALQYIAHEEGRARIVYPPYTAPYYAFDYYIKDHLGNVRVTLTDEQLNDTYPAATLETGSVASEKLLYNIVDDASHIIPTSSLGWWSGVSGTGYLNNNGVPAPPDPTINPNGASANLYKLNGLSGDRFGMGIALKVMAGDVVNVFGKSVWHNNGSGTVNSYPVSGVLSSFINAFAGTSAVTGGSKGAATGGVLNSNPATTGNLSTWLGTVPNPGGSTPKAYINWVLFDEQFKPVQNGSSFDLVNTTADVIKSHNITGINMIKSGYLYVYCSNESNQDVYFDNLQVVHNRGPIIEEEHYYPQGLTMFGLSGRAFGKQVTAGFQGKEFQGGEFYDGSGLEEYDFAARFYDPQLGRWWVQDPVTRFASPYSAMANNPTQYIDPDGKNPLVVAFIIGAVVGGYTGYQIAAAKGYNLGDIKAWGYIIGGAAIGGMSGYCSASIAAGGGFMANTMGIMFSSMYSSIGMSMLSGGMMPVSISFGAASINLETGEFGYLGKKGNSFLDNLGYSFGAMANLQDAFAGVRGANVKYTAESGDGVPHARLDGEYVKQDANGATVTKKIDISVAHDPAPAGAYKYDGPNNFINSLDYARYWATHIVKGTYYPLGYAQNGPNLILNNVNGKWLNTMTNNIKAGVGKWGIGSLKYGTTLFGCQSHVAQALWGVGIPTLPINFHPLVLYVQLAARQAGIWAQPMLLNRDALR